MTAAAVAHSLRRLLRSLRQKPDLPIEGKFRSRPVQLRVTCTRLGAVSITPAHPSGPTSRVQMGNADALPLIPTIETSRRRVLRANSVSGLEAIVVSVLPVWDPEAPIPAPSVTRPPARVRMANETFERSMHAYLQIATTTSRAAAICRS